MRSIIILFILFLQTLVSAQTSEEEEVLTLASCSKKDFEFSDWMSTINHKITEKGVHIFAIEITNVFTPNPNKKEFWVEFAIGPIPIHTEGSFDSLKNSLELCNYAHLPIIGKVKLGCGTAIGGRISICFDVRLVRGKHNFRIESDMLYLEFEDFVVGIEDPFKESVDLIPLPHSGTSGQAQEDQEGGGDESEP